MPHARPVSTEPASTPHTRTPPARTSAEGRAPAGARAARPADGANEGKGPLAGAVALALAETDGFIRARLGAAVFLVLVTAVLAGLAPVALKYAVDGLGTGQARTVALTGGQAVALGPGLLIALYLGGLWASRTFGEMRWYLYGTADRRLHRNLSRRLLDHVIKLPMSFHLDRKTGALNQTLVQGLAGYSILLNHAIFTLLPVLVELAIIGAVIAAFLDSGFVLILIGSIAAYGAAFTLGVRQIIRPSRAVSTAQVDAFANMTDSILNTETVKYFTAEREVKARYDTALKKSEAEWRRFYLRKSLNGVLVACVFALSLGAAIFLGVSQVTAGVMTVGDFVLVNAYMLQIVKPMETLGAAFRDIAYGAAFIEKMADLMAREREPGSLPEADTHRPPTRNISAAAQAAQESQATQTLRGDMGAAAGAGELVFDTVRFSYLPGKPVLKGISFTVGRGKTVAIVGGSGAGKSSIIRLLMRLYDPDGPSGADGGSGEKGGDIRLNGVSTRALPLDALRQAIAIVPQDTVLFNDSIAYNIAFGRPGCARGEIERAAKLAHIHDRVMAMPDGYDTIVGERGLKLSGGEKQRVSIARAALKNPQIFVFDEATSSLDSRTERDILDNLIAVSRGMTTLVIAHRLSTVVHADTIIVLDQGRIVERGSHSALLQQGGLYAAMWHTQHQGNTNSLSEKEIA
ncbi:ABC transporter transmembrane domain-containing protein [Eilatimonas milleporae]|uniref:ATP-binding cassette subfamily B protein n=1 Tax=Eilatimonas milleporae TaxID=911205 RepID=A0A3M0CEA3_9PROT|nr:ABC transporter ATP-binding protein [Eilatimonas milleporae]RMB07672.1 ATP-binding cassette subfamily B protein [Eilatimonas milleporae]